MTKQNNVVFRNIMFPERLKQVLSETNTTHQELATVLGVQRQTVSLYVNGQIRPDIGALAAIAQFFCVTADWLLGLTNDRNRVPVATDELGLSECAVGKIKNYHNWDSSGRKRAFSSLDAIICHDDFEELLEDCDMAVENCNEVLSVYATGETESHGVKKAMSADKLLEGTNWKVVPGAKYARYLVHSTQEVFHKIITDITKSESIDAVMEY